MNFNNFDNNRVLPKVKPREFNLHTKENEEFSVVTKQVGSFVDVYKKTKNDVEAEVPHGVLAVVDAFKNHQASFAKGEKEIEKRPHLLITGGFVRDILLNVDSNDIDFATDLTAIEAYDLLKDLPGLKKIGKHGKSSEIVRLNFENGEEYEISHFKREEEKKNNLDSHTPGDDALARDLTINSIFYNPFSGNIIDYADGIKDIEEKKIRFTGDANKRIEEDPLRMFRYVRFLLKTGFDSNDIDKQAIINQADSVEKIDKGRVKDETEKILSIAPLRDFLEKIDELNLLESYLPDIKKLQQCEQGPPYHLEGDVYKHTMMVADNLPVDASSRLKWATIFHDIAKPETREETEKDGQKKVSFLHHDKIGAKRVKELLKKLKFSKNEIADISWMIDNHQAIFQKIVQRIDNSPEKSKHKARIKSKAVIKEMISEKGIEVVSDLVDLAVADSRGKITSEELEDKRDDLLIIEVFKEALEELEKEQESGIDIKKLINGKFIMKVFSIKPGPEIGVKQREIVSKIREEGIEFESAEEVEEFVISLK